MANTPSFNWETPDDTDLVKDGAAAIRTLGNAIDSSMTDLKGGTTGQVLSKASNTDMDFTWVAQDDSNAIQNALLTTTGDTIYASSASTPARLGIGSSGQVLTVSGGVPAWTTISSGGMTLIQETVANANSSISFSSIPNTYKQLLLVWSGIKHSAAGNSFVVRANNSGSIVCNYHTIRAVGTSTTAQNGATTYGIGGNSIYSFGENASSVVAGYEFRAAAGWISIDDYASTSKYKSVRFNYGWQNDNTGESVVNSGEGWLETTSAISSLDVYRITGTGTITNLTNTSIRLYGVS